MNDKTNFPEEKAEVPPKGYMKTFEEKKTTQKRIIHVPAEYPSVSFTSKGCLRPSVQSTH